MPTDTAKREGKALEKLFQAQSVAKLTEAFAQDNIAECAGLDVRNACDVISRLIEEAIEALDPAAETAPEGGDNG